jgi:thioredoxin-dependent peroxiredoxin
MNVALPLFVVSLFSGAVEQAPQATPAAAPAAPAQAARPAVGDPAPGFTAPSTQGPALGLADFKGKQSVVLAFYPKAFTGGCTKEMEGFRDRMAEFTAAGAQVLGISKDDLETQKRFAESLKLGFPLLSDTDGTVARAFGVDKGEYAARVTFVIGKDGVVKQVIEGREAIDPSGALMACTR